MVRWSTASLLVALTALSSSGAALAAEEDNMADLRRLGAQELLRRAGMEHEQPAEMAEMEAQLGAQAEASDDTTAHQMAAVAAPLAHSGRGGGEEEVNMDDVEKKLAQVGLPSEAISAAVDEAVETGSIQDPEEMKPAERASVAAKAADAVARDQVESTPGGRKSRDPWLAFAGSLQETGVGSKCTTTCTRNRRSKMNKCETVCEPHEGLSLKARVKIPRMRTANVSPVRKVAEKKKSGSEEEAQDSGSTEEEQYPGSTGTEEQQEEQNSDTTEEEEPDSNSVG